MLKLRKVSEAIFPMIRFCDGLVKMKILKIIFGA